MTDDELRACIGKMFMHKISRATRVVIGVEQLPDVTSAMRVYAVMWRHPSRGAGHNRSLVRIFRKWMEHAVEVSAPAGHRGS